MVEYGTCLSAFIVIMMNLAIVQHGRVWGQTGTV